jgi:hypothetical protein
MNKYDESQKLTKVQFKRIIGVNKATLEEMSSVLQKGYANKRKRRGRQSTLAVELQLMMPLEYLTHTSPLRNRGLTMAFAGARRRIMSYGQETR